MALGWFSCFICLCCPVIDDLPIHPLIPCTGELAFGIYIQKPALFAFAIVALILESLEVGDSDKRYMSRGILSSCELECRVHTRNYLGEVRDISDNVSGNFDVPEALYALYEVTGISLAQKFVML